METTKSSKHREFYKLPDHPNDENPCINEKKEHLVEYINNNIIGNTSTFLSPFGRRRVIYCDYTASGKALKFIEDFLASEVLTLYGNTHTTTSVTSLQTTLYRHEARDIIRNSCHASELDAVIFTGSGTTGAVHKLIQGLRLGQEGESVTVMVGPHEHHSNLLPWRETGATMVTIQHDPLSGRTDLHHLEQELISRQGRGDRLVGCFSAASNVTGVMEDDLAVTALLHKHGALAFWDYATAAPYVHVDMNPKVPEDHASLCYKDAVYFSPHKFVGGVQTPGVLIAKKSLFQNRVPNSAGGGSVFFVTLEDHRYLQEPEVREEGGTPAIVESVRAGLVVKLKQAAGPEFIMKREEQWLRQAVTAWAGLENLLLLSGETIQPGSHLPIFSFLIRHPQTGLFLHHNFVVALLNDMYGIQARGGCACAGPYMQRLLGLDPNLVRRFESLLLEDSRLDRVGLRRGHAEHSQWEVLRPGATRLNLAWFSSQEEVSFVIAAVVAVARHGWSLLPLYRLNNETGEWRHSANSVFKDRKWLGSVSFASGKMELSRNPLASEGIVDESLEGCLKTAEDIFTGATKLASRVTVPDQAVAFPEEVAELRWFLLPSEAKDSLQGKQVVPRGISPFSPPGTTLPTIDPGDGFIPGSLSGVCKLTPATNQLVLAESSPWLPDKRQLVRLSTRRPRGVKIPSTNLNRSDSVTVNGSSSVTVNGESTVDSVGNVSTGKITVNGFKSVISVSRDGDESSEMIFDDEENNYDIIETVGELSKGTDGTNKNCDSELCTLPEGKRSDPIPCLAANTAKWKSPPKELFKPFMEAVTEFSMIKEGDRVLVCLSGGKDSLSLLHTLRQYQIYARNTSGLDFTFGAVTVDPLSSAYDPRPLVPYLAQLGVDYFYEQQDIMNQALEAKATSICAFCSRMKRGRIYAAARREGYNVLAMGQHLDDIAESFFMSVFHNGRLRTMKASYTNTEGDLRIIRPLVYVREKQLRGFAEQSKLPVIAENCPACFEAPKERQRTKQLLAQQELLFPRLYWNLKTALYPVMCIDKTGVESVLFGRNVEEVGEEEDAAVF